MSHPFDVVGYTADADVYCPPCARNIYGDGLSSENGIKDHEGNLIGPVFADSEWDYPITCGKCDVYIDTKLTSDGIDYAYEMIDTALENKTVTLFLMEVADSLLWMKLDKDDTRNFIKVNRVLEYVDLRGKYAAQL